jgi:hypothetical protein
MKKFQGLVLAVFGSALALACGGSGDTNDNLHTVLACEVVDGGSCLNGSAGMNTAGAAGDSAVDPGSDSGVGGRAPSTGGKASSTGGNQSTGGSSQAGASPQGGQAPGTGGSAPTNGGNQSTGGTVTVTGGTAPGTGGTVTGGSNPGTGGSNPSTGGTSPQATGGSTPASTGGNQSTGGTQTATCSVGMTQSCVGPGNCAGLQRCQVGSPPWGPCECGTGGTGTGGSNPGTGGSTPQSTGGKTSTGGNTSTGGTNPTTGGTGTGGQQPTTGGQGTGGVNTSTGGNATGGTAPTCVPSPRPAPAAAGTAINCSPIPDTTFPNNRGLNGKLDCSSGECFLLSGRGTLNDEILHKVNGTWVAETLPPSVIPKDAGDAALTLVGLSASSLTNVWATGNYGNSSTVLQRKSDGTYADVSAGLSPKAGWTIGSVNAVYATGSTAFVAANETNPATGEFDVAVFQRVGTSWKAFDLPAHDLHVGYYRLWGTSEKDVYAAGCIVDSNYDCAHGFLWSFDGCSWTDQSAKLPSDLATIVGIHGKSGTIIVVGFTGQGSAKTGVRLVSSDLNNWTRSNNVAQSVDGEGVYLFDRQNAISGATLIDGSGNALSNGARIAVMSGGVWGNPVPTGGASDEGVTGVSVADHVYIATQGPAGARMYVCN